MTDTIFIQGEEIAITDPHRVLWPKYGITKRDYLDYLLKVSPAISNVGENSGEEGKKDIL